MLTIESGRNKNAQQISRTTRTYFVIILIETELFKIFNAPVSLPEPKRKTVKRLSSVFKQIDNEFCIVLNFLHFSCCTVRALK